MTVERSLIQTIIWISLYHHTIDARKAVKVADIATSIISPQGREYLIRHDSGTQTLSGIHIDLPLGIVDFERRKSHCQFGALIQRVDKLTGDAKKLCEITSSLVLHLDIECITHIIARYHTRSHSKNCSILDISGTGINLSDYCLHVIFFLRSFIPRCKANKENTGRITRTTH